MVWAGFQVLLGEVNAGLSTTQVVVKELKASASVQEQMQFLEEVQPYRYTPFLLSLLPHFFFTLFTPPFFLLILCCMLKHMPFFVSTSNLEAQTETTLTLALIWNV